MLGFPGGHVEHPLAADLLDTDVRVLGVDRVAEFHEETGIDLAAKQDVALREHHETHPANVAGSRSCCRFP
ncbi:MAG: hypothetical protein HZY75_13140 [Nocardioidaceae bacterium]|nr:MAG: hypothetical protein HZY75_13140 [Nocardioidaceae bacterium]